MECRKLNDKDILALLDVMKHTGYLAHSNLADANHEWACFAAQQSAEKFLKAFLYAQGQATLDASAV